MREYRNPLGILTGTAMLLLATQPLQAATSLSVETQPEIDEVRESPVVSGQGLSDSTTQLIEQTLKLSKQPKNFLSSSSNLAVENLKKTPQLLFKSLEKTSKPGIALEAIAPEPANPSDRSVPHSDKELNREAKRTETPKLLAQTPGILVPNPEITIEGQTPGELPPTVPMPEASAAPPVLPRAVAPPVGDIAVSNINAAPELIDLGSDIRVPRLVLRDAPAREVLALLARSAGLNLVFTGGTGQETVGEPIVSLDLENEPVQDVFNSVLLVSGLSANRRGNTIFVGPQLPDVARNLVSRTLRLNQVQVNNAATFLATQGAEVQQVITPVIEITDPQTQRVVRREEQPPELRPLTVSPSEGSTAPLLLSGLKVSTDDRLNSITLVGEPRHVQMATSFLTQLDARRRQVAVNVKVIDVNLTNDETFDASFSFGVGDTFFTQDGGSAVVNFGGINPPNGASVTGGAFAPPVVPFDSTIVVPEGSTLNLEPFIDQSDAPFDDVEQRTSDFPSSGSFVPYSRLNFGAENNPFQPGLTEVEVDDEGTTTYTFSPPGLFQYPQRFLSTLQAQIVSGNAKILTDPTLVVQEGQEATVRLVQDVVTSVNTLIDSLSGVRTIVPVLGEAGLILNISIERIDDNGFINLSISPVVSSIGATQVFESGAGSDNVINLLNRRELSSGLLRLRDGQTLIVSGIIQESDQTTVSKVPVLGDIPLLGALFRSTDTTTERNEVIILLTPQIVDERSEQGYSYTPGPDARDVLRRQGFTVPGTP